jgi:hypothetical protein
VLDIIRLLILHPHAVQYYQRKQETLQSMLQLAVTEVRAQRQLCSHGHGHRGSAASYGRRTTSIGS